MKLGSAGVRLSAWWPFRMQIQLVQKMGQRLCLQQSPALEKPTQPMGLVVQRRVFFSWTWENLMRAPFLLCPGEGTAHVNAAFGCRACRPNPRSAPPFAYCTLKLLQASVKACTLSWVQVAQSVDDQSKIPLKSNQISPIALCLSENKVKGQGGPTLLPRGNQCASSRHLLEGTEVASTVDSEFFPPSSAMRGFFLGPIFLQG